MSDAPLPPAPSRAPSSSGTPIVVVVMIVAFVLVFIVGILAAIAIPAFIKYMRRAKAAEAQTNIELIVRGIEARHADRHTLPPSIAATPGATAPGCAARPWPADAPPAWAELGFAPFGPLHYAYSIDAAPDGQTVYVRAVGDLDCDGISGRFERIVATTPDGRTVAGPLIRTDELE